MSSRITGALLIAAAGLFWLSWLLMPGVGVTDAAQIFDLVGRNRSSVMLSILTQLISAVLYVPALLGIACACYETRIRWGISLLLLGAMGSAMDAVFHLLAYAMTMPGLERRSLLMVMAYMQGPGLRLVAPFILSFFVGSLLLTLELKRMRLLSKESIYPYLIALSVAVLGGAAVAFGLISGRLVGLTVLGMISLAQAWAGSRMTSLKGRLGAEPSSFVPIPTGRTCHFRVSLPQVESAGAAPTVGSGPAVRERKR